jgi:C1A family cysteine protease
VSTRSYGTLRDAPDARDCAFPASRHRGHPQSVDLRCGLPVYNQRSLNSCSANAIAAAIRFDHLRSGTRGALNPSRLFLYFNERSIEGCVPKNVPVSLRDGYKTLARLGVCSEEHWPYRVRQFARHPPHDCYNHAAAHRAIRYMRLKQDLTHIRDCLASGYPFTAGISVYPSIHDERVKRTGNIPMPKRGEKMLGGHAVLVVGYDDRERHVIVQNSWGRGWGAGGYCFLPYDFFLHGDHAWDLWTVRRMNDDLSRAQR